MFGSLGTLVTGIITSAIDTLAVPIVAAGLFAGGATWAIGDHRAGRSIVIAALVGGAVMLLALTLAQSLGSVGLGH
ncbi:MAG: hypothetical protein V4529_17410 [Gemmatimonadota bacterium]